MSILDPIIGPNCKKEHLKGLLYEARRLINESLVVVVGICPKKLRFGSNKVQSASIVIWNNFDDLDLEGMVRKVMLQHDLLF